MLFAASFVCFVGFLFILPHGFSDQPTEMSKRSVIENKYVLNNLSLKLINGKCVICLSLNEWITASDNKYSFFPVARIASY